MKRTYHYSLINESNGNCLMKSRTLKALTDYLRITLFKTGTKFRIQRTIYTNGYIDEIQLNYKQYIIA